MAGILFKRSWIAYLMVLLCGTAGYLVAVSLSAAAEIIYRTGVALWWVLYLIT
jgi:hypothetical protein